MQGETAERILKTAKGLMVERGYSAFSYADISEAVAITKASIHFHFPTKAILAVAVLKAHRQELVKATEMLDQKIANPLERIHAYVRYWESCIRDRTMPFCIAALLAAELPSLPKEVQGEVRLHFDCLEKWLERTLKAGARKSTIQLQAPAATEAQVLMAIVHGAMLSARATGSDSVFKNITDAALKRFSPKVNG
jgi:TetR/AcrR family transcriptional repressor of nem operon